MAFIEKGQEIDIEVIKGRNTTVCGSLATKEGRDEKRWQILFLEKMIVSFGRLVRYI